MPSTKTMTGASALYAIFSLLPPALCHMQMSWPYPLRSEFNPATPESEIDYSMTSPLNADGSNLPCKGYQNDRPIETTVTYAAGSTYNMTLAGSATHGGGSCQLSLSYDNGATFSVIKSMIGGCPLTSTYDFTVPTFAPNGVALFAWTWQNYEGNREFYMNCAEVKIVSGISRRQKRQTFDSMDSLPYIWKANLPGVNNCTTVQPSENPVYPNPGPDVIYGDGMSSSSPASPGDCDSPTPYGQTYEDLGDSSSPSAGTSAVSEALSAPTEDAADATPVQGMMSMEAASTTAQNGAAATPLDANAGDRVAGSTVSAIDSAPSTTTVTVDCPGATTMTVYESNPSTSTITVPPPSVFTYTTSAPASVCTGTTANCPCIQGYSCMAIGQCTWACILQSSTTPAFATCTSSPQPTAVISTATVVPVAASTAASSTFVSPPAQTESGASPDCYEWYVVQTGDTCDAIEQTYSITSAQFMAWNPEVDSACDIYAGYAYCINGPSSSSPTAAATTVATQGASSPQQTPPYATGDVEAYLPCVPGTFICTSNTTWETCDYNDGSVSSSSSSSIVYDYPRVVSAGMECIPYLSPYSSSTDSNGQQSMRPAGYYRDDRVVRVQPYGSCTNDGSIECQDGGQQFLICDQGGWVLMGDVADGTMCENGEIVSQ